MSAPDYRPRNSTSYDNNGVSHQLAVEGNVLTLVPPATAVQDARPVPLPRAQKPNALKPPPSPLQPAVVPASQMQQPAVVPALQVQQPAPVPVAASHVQLQPTIVQYGYPQMMPPPYYQGQSVGMPQQQQPPPLTPAANPAQQSKFTFNKADYGVQVNASCSFCTLWRGILEIIARVGVMVVAVFCLIISAAIIHRVDNNEYFDVILIVDDTTDIIGDVQDLIKDTKAVSGFMIFVALIVFLVQVPMTVSRFVVRTGVGLLRVLHAVDAFANVLLGIFFLGGAASSASYSSQWNEPPLVCEDAFIDELDQPSFSCDEEILGGQLAALAVWGFIGMGIAIYLTVWTILALVTKWDYAASKRADATGGAEPNTD